MTIKQQIQAVIETLPEDTTIERAIEELRMLEGILAGLADIQAGRVISHEQVKALMLERMGQTHGTH